MNPLISICIPAYKNIQYLDVLLRSVADQTFRDFEVVLSDDSPDDAVGELCKKYADRFPLRYVKNTPAKGSPANWNAGIQQANGRWIKVMHDDDWFSSPKSLQAFANAIDQHPEAGFIFSGYCKYEDGTLKETHLVKEYVVQKMRRSPLCLISNNEIGHPSTTIFKNNIVAPFDENTKWVVDIEFYIRCLQAVPFSFISEALVNIGVNNEQITKSAFRNPEVEIPEYLYLLNKMGIVILKDIRVYDHYWRLLRNLKIRSEAHLQHFAKENSIAKPISKMLSFQRRIPLPVLKVGLFSKFFMGASYLMQ